MIIQYPEALEIIFDKLKTYDIKPVIVGGYIRDLFAGIESKDIDIELYGIVSFKELQKLLKEFGEVNIVGKSFGVCKLYFQEYDLDFSFPRIDSKVEAGHKGFDVKIDATLDYKTAASRRDFTINSVGYDVIEKKILDPFKGIEDFKNKILRSIDLNSFAQDPLRVLRAVQFATRFDLFIEKNLFKTCKYMVMQKEFQELPKERIFEEIKKLLLYAKKPSQGFLLLKKLGSDIYTKNYILLDYIAKQRSNNKEKNIVLMLAALCYDFSEKEAQKFIKKLTNEKKLLQRVNTLIQNNDAIKYIYEKETIDDYRLYKTATRVKIEDLVVLSRAIYLTKNDSKIFKAIQKVEQRAKELQIFNQKLQPLLMGKDLLEFRLKPSPLFTKILSLAYEAQMQGVFYDKKGAKKWLRENLDSLNKEFKVSSCLSR